MTDSDMIRAALVDNAHALQQARADADLFARLSSAKVEVARLQKAGADLTAKLSAAEDAEAKAERAARRAKYRNPRVTATFADTRETGALKAAITIKWEGPRWDYQTGGSDWSAFEATGFHALLSHHRDVFDWLMEFHSDALPNAILDLVPGDPEAAMEHYLFCLGRGFQSPAGAVPALADLYQ